MKIDSIKGTAVAVIGDDIDTDQIAPAQHLKVLSFKGIDQVFLLEQRNAFRDRPEIHPLDDPRFEGSSILLVGRNFGCGSSREHASQAIRRWGIRAIIGESFSEIFRSNSFAIGMPCLCVPAPVIEELRFHLEHDPTMVINISLSDSKIQYTDNECSFQMPEFERMSFLSGRWDALQQLLNNEPMICQVEARLPYLNDWR